MKQLSSGRSGRSPVRRPEPPVLEPRLPWWQRGVRRLGLTLFKGIFSVLFRSVRSSWPYQEGVRLARSHPEVVRALGEPIEAGWLFSGSLRVVGPKGNARLTVPLRGPRGTAALLVVATKVAGEWEFEQAGVTVTGSDVFIDLLPRCIDVEPEA